MSDDQELAEDPAPEDGPTELSTVNIQDVLDGLRDAVVVADEGSRIVYVNAGTERLLGWKRRDLVGQPLTTIMPERLREAHVAGMARYLLTHDPRVIGKRPIRVAARDRSGKEVGAQLSFSAQRLAADLAMVVGSVRDVSARVRLGA